MVLNEIDSELLVQLSKNGKASQRALAKETGAALGTVNAHVKQLENRKIIKGYFANIDPEKVGFKLTAIINLRIKKGTLIDVQASIAKHSRVFGVYDVTGEWDSLILARFKDREEMDKFIKTTLSQKHIERTSTSLVLNTVKEEPRVML
ncbi:MAG: Lrp/AsnC family transcriptional regulator [Candidatus Thermoplasmatota archaeon]|jgi:DNA-binding Lrp family transcriptional regulator|nr:Lrp/AsnC family transcriptional regulator [Candidatus Thermoplasmatota archaeon]MEC7416317.1 Lrp/AsnC family transcriptional regulator [Candidatus Thermoplasmatota archaeon]MEC7697511.1 Lrp/AsnC family transcriptional regulator [Candidatus Thermoplasmatota archaeon]MEC7976436.1 Lrp/AsnC family transcriptional regulator [Candidatus Thermoplasmatota archaeon]MEC8216745.1 Lrp/AsnC family transcriptional regulator [Candidatus Thermoplasmatota archaeon]|tara:strand:- start:1078 stop:1524 length:447 start_codon:yes stop_codon:yes gene_type:complete